MAKFKKKPVVIEAAQFFKHVMPWPEGVGWYDPNPSGRDEPYPALQTLWGPIRCSDGDWIIYEERGVRYLCKPNVFAETYEPVFELPTCTCGNSAVCAGMCGPPPCKPDCATMQTAQGGAYKPHDTIRQIT